MWTLNFVKALFYRMKYLMSAYGILEILRNYFNRNSWGSMGKKGDTCNTFSNKEKFKKIVIPPLAYGSSAWQLVEQVHVHCLEYMCNVTTFGNFVSHNLSFWDLTNAYANFPIWNVYNHIFLSHSFVNNFTWFCYMEKHTYLSGLYR